MLYFLAQSFRGRLLHELPQDKQKLGKDGQFLAHRAKALMKDLSAISYEIAQMVISADEDKVLPEWFMLEIVRDLPRLAGVQSHTPTPSGQDTHLYSKKSRHTNIHRHSCSCRADSGR